MSFLPIGKFEWERVAARYNAKYPTRPRLMRNLRNRFNNYAGKKPPTGDPDCPPLVRKAKQINQLFKSKAGVTILNNDEGDNGAGPCVGVVAGKGNADTVVQSKKSRADKNGNNNTDRFLQAYLASEKMQAKRDAKEEKLRHEERQENMRLLMGTMTSLAAALTGKSIEAPMAPVRPAIKHRAPSSSSNSGSSSDSSVSSVASSSSESVNVESNKRKRLSFNQKLKKLKRKQKKLMKAMAKKSPDKTKDSDSEYEEVDARDIYGPPRANI
jgi:hypothetical protein